MSFTLNYILLSFALTLLPKTDTVSVKCMVEMKNYSGEGAYVSVSVVNNEDYLKTIYVFGNDKAWFSEMNFFWKHIRDNKLYLDEDFYPLIDGVTGATISGSQKRVFILNIPRSLINKNYNLRFETAVEDKEYFVDDVNIVLSKEGLNVSYEGQGFIQSIKFIYSN